MNRWVALVMLALFVLVGFLAAIEYQQNRIYIEKGYCHVVESGRWLWKPCEGGAR